MERQHPQDQRRRPIYRIVFWIFCDQVGFRLVTECDTTLKVALADRYCRRRPRNLDCRWLPGPFQERLEEKLASPTVVFLVILRSWAGAATPMATSTATAADIFCK